MSVLRGGAARWSKASAEARFCVHAELRLEGNAEACGSCEVCLGSDPVDCTHPPPRGPVTSTEEDLQREKDKRLGIGAALVSGAVAVSIICYLITNPTIIDMLLDALTALTVMS